MKRVSILFLIMISIIFSVQVFAEVTPEKEPHNTLLISIDGLSPRIFYALLNKGKLPNIKSAIQNGTYRNMDIEEQKIDTLPCYTKILTGYYNELLYDGDENTMYPIPEGLSLFERMKSVFPKMLTVAIFTAPENPYNPVLINGIFNESFINKFVPYPEVKRNAAEVVQLVKTELMHSNPPFFMFFNFTDVELAGYTYREGAAAYSKAAIDCDKAVGEIIALFKEKGIYDNTDIIFTTKHGFKPKSRLVQNSRKTWVAANFKIPNKGSQKSIVPTIFQRYKLKGWKDEFYPFYKGKVLIY